MFEISTRRDPDHKFTFLCCRRAIHQSLLYFSSDDAADAALARTTTSAHAHCVIDASQEMISEVGASPLGSPRISHHPVQVSSATGQALALTLPESVPIFGEVLVYVEVINVRRGGQIDVLSFASHGEPIPAGLRDKLTSAATLLASSSAQG